MSDWLRNPAANDEERRLIRLVRYAVREEVSRLVLWLIVAAGLFQLVWDFLR